ERAGVPIRDGAAQVRNRPDPALPGYRVDRGERQAGTRVFRGPPHPSGEPDGAAPGDRDDRAVQHHRPRRRRWRQRSGGSDPARHRPGPAQGRRRAAAHLEAGQVADPRRPGEGAQEGGSQAGPQGAPVHEAV
ncbi:MAG: SSU ribosomal protein S9p (S16e), partial [uncultured Thermomicrobiales bacterium]